MNYLDFVDRITQLNSEAVKIDLPHTEKKAPEIQPSKKNVLIFSPHPDDESITGALALRLRKETQHQIINIPVTLGSDLKRRNERRQELEAACAVLGFSIHDLLDSGLNKISPDSQNINPQKWNDDVEIICDVIKQFDPVGIIFPHAEDLHPTHIGTNRLVFDALAGIVQTKPIMLFESEYWHPMQTPNLLLESSNQDVALLIEAIACHHGEVNRTPYHLTQPSWMAENVRRGSEIMGTFGSNAVTFQFATLYRKSSWYNGQSHKATKPLIVEQNHEDLAKLFDM
ncbi:MAG: PIG-L deacetylase family protein [Bdellovibrionales bacterium]